MTLNPTTTCSIVGAKAALQTFIHATMVSGPIQFHASPTVALGGTASRCTTLEIAVHFAKAASYAPEQNVEVFIGGLKRLPF